MNPHWHAAAMPFACTARIEIFGDQPSEKWFMASLTAWGSTPHDADASTAGRKSRTEAPPQRKAAARTAPSASTLDACLVRLGFDRNITCAMRRVMTIAAATDDGREDRDVRVLPVGWLRTFVTAAHVG